MSEQKKQELIKEVQNLAKKLGRTPRMIDFYNINDVKTYFKTWNNFVTQAGLKPNAVIRRFNQYTKNEILEMVSNELQRIGSVSLSEYERKKSHAAPTFYHILKITELKSWKEVLEKIGYKAIREPLNRTKHISKCKVDGCDETEKAKGYCQKHYEQQWRLGFIKFEKTEEEKKLHIERMRSRKARKDNKTGVKGVSLISNGKYIARIVVNYKEIHLGTFETLEEAKQARINAEKRFFIKT